MFLQNILYLQNVRKVSGTNQASYYPYEDKGGIVKMSITNKFISKFNIIPKTLRKVR